MIWQVIGRRQNRRLAMFESAHVCKNTYLLTYFEQTLTMTNGKILGFNARLKVRPMTLANFLPKCQSLTINISGSNKKAAAYWKLALVVRPPLKLVILTTNICRSQYWLLKYQVTTFFLLLLNFFARHPFCVFVQSREMFSFLINTHTWL